MKKPNLERLLTEEGFLMVVPLQDMITRQPCELMYNSKKKLYAYYTLKTDKVKYFKEVKYR